MPSSTAADDIEVTFDVSNQKLIVKRPKPLSHRFVFSVHHGLSVSIKTLSSAILMVQFAGRFTCKFAFYMNISMIIGIFLGVLSLREESLSRDCCQAADDERVRFGECSSTIIVNIQNNLV